MYSLVTDPKFMGCLDAGFAGVAKNLSFAVRPVDDKDDDDDGDAKEDAEVPNAEAEAATAEAGTAAGDGVAT